MLTFGIMVIKPLGVREDLLQTGKHSGLALLDSDNLGLSLVRDNLELKRNNSVLWDRIYAHLQWLRIWKIQFIPIRDCSENMDIEKCIFVS